MPCCHRAVIWLALLAAIAPFARPPAALAAGQRDRAALTVTTEPVMRQALSSAIMATGTVTAWRQLQIQSEASGLAVAAVNAEEGQRVKTGDLLVQLSDAVLVTQIAQQQSAIAEARANLKIAEANLERGRTLIGNQTISAQTLDERANTVDTTKAKLAAAEALLAQFQAQLAQTRIAAPANGLIVVRSVNIGQVVSAGTELFRIAQDDRLEVDALVPESDLLAIAPGAKALITAPGGHQSKATVRAIAPSVDARTRLGTVHVALPKDAPLRLGMFARADIYAKAATAMTVPEQAVVWRDGAAQVFVVGDDNVVVQRPVTTARHVAGYVEITGGLTGDETIVSQGAGFLNDGDLVNVELAQNAEGTR